MQSPRHKRVYLNESGGIAARELAFMGGSWRNIREEDIGGVPYILFDCKELDIRMLSRLSFTHAIFELQGRLLAPVIKDTDYYIDEDISAILKYSGKTNELFTRLMLNLALAYCPDEKIKLLDPMAGKGTTLYEGLVRGMDVYGVEIEPKPAYESFTYIKKYLELARYKHSSHTEKTGGIDVSGKKFSAVRYQVEMARSKEEQKDKNICLYEMIAGDTRHVGYFYKKNFFNAVLADLPYGVLHGAKTKPQEAGLTRNAMGLLQEAMPGWIKVLKFGGVMVLAWNLFLIGRKQMEELFEKHGLTVVETDFAHRLDQATHRDLIIGVYKGV